MKILLTEDRTEPAIPGTGPVLDRSQAEKWHGFPVPPLFFVGHGQTVLRGTAVPPILFGPSSFFGARSARAEWHDRATIFIQSTDLDRDLTEDRKWKFFRPRTGSK